MNIDELFNSVSTRGANLEAREDKSSKSHTNPPAAKRQSDHMILTREGGKETQFLDGYDAMVNKVLE